MRIIITSSIIQLCLPIMLQ